MQDFITTQLYNDKEWENALENGFRPAPATGTPADRLRHLLEEGMNEETEEVEKIAQSAETPTFANTIAASCSTRSFSKG